MCAFRTISGGSNDLAVYSVSENLAPFVAPQILVISYANLEDMVLSDSYSNSDILNWQGVPLFISKFYNFPRNQNVGPLDVEYFCAFNVIENLETIDTISGSNQDGITDSCVLNGNKLQVSRIDNRYYLDVVILNALPEPTELFVLQGTPLAIGSNNELILNKTSYTMDDISPNADDPSLPVRDLIEIMIGGVPITAGRIGNSYYLIVHPVENFS